MEIYPYQRIVENKSRRREKKKEPARFQLPELHLAVVSRRIGQGLAQMMTAGNVLMALGALIMARAFILGELLPYIYAFMAAFTWKSRERSTVVAIFALLGFGSVLSS